MSSVLIVNAQLVNEGSCKAADVFVKDGRIQQIGDNLSHIEADTVLDLEGNHLLPGMIDDQVHFREPGLTHKGDIATESRAAVAGGITSYMEMPNVKPATLDGAAIEDKCARANGRSWCNYGFYLGASNNNLEAIKSIDPGAVCGVKVFMGASTGNMLVDRREVLEGIFANSPVLIATHCEDTPMIAALEREFREKYGDDLPMHYHKDIRSEEACYASSSLAVDLAKQFNSQLHVLHITTEKELSLFTAGDVVGKSITAEACVHHLFFSDKDYEAKETLIKCNPSIKLESDRQAILAAVKNDVIDIVATDHAPHTLEEKHQSYFKAPAGLPLVQFALQSLLEHYHRGVLSLEQIVAKTSHNVARRYQVQDRGFIREGYFADLVAVNLQQPYTVQRENVLSKCGWSPFEDQTFSSTILSTLVNGQVMYNQGRVLEMPPVGMRLSYTR